MPRELQRLHFWEKLPHFYSPQLTFLPPRATMKETHYSGGYKTRRIFPIFLLLFCFIAMHVNAFAYKVTVQASPSEVTVACGETANFTVLGSCDENSNPKKEHPPGDFQWKFIGVTVYSDDEAKEENKITNHGLTFKYSGTDTEIGTDPNWEKLMHIQKR